MDEWFGIVGRIVISVLVIGVIYAFMNTNLNTFLSTQWTSILH